MLLAGKELNRGYEFRPQFFLLVDLRFFFSDLGSGDKKKALKMTN